MNKLIPKLALILNLIVNTAYGETFHILTGNDSLIGEVRYIYSRADQTLVDIARDYDLGYDQIIKANPGVNRWLPGDNTKIILPHRYILPGNIRNGIVLNIAELRLYYFPASKKNQPNTVVYSFPVSIGRMDWKTPLGATKVIKKERDPAWRPPQSIREEHARDGEMLPLVIPGSAPDNPLGRFALRLGFPGYLIHGVDERKTYGIGMRVTHGCVRMYPTDIERLFALTTVNTPVHIMNQPIKLGWQENKLYLEVHQPLNEGEDESAPELPRIIAVDVISFIRNQIDSTIEFDEELVSAITEIGNGIPHPIAQMQNNYEIAVQDKESNDLSCNNADCSSNTEDPLELEYQKAIQRHLLVH